MDSHFATAALKFYFTYVRPISPFVFPSNSLNALQEPVDAKQDVLEQLSQEQRTDITAIEMLPAGSLGLPESPEPVFMVEVVGLCASLPPRMSAVDSWH